MYVYMSKYVYLCVYPYIVIFYLLILFSLSWTFNDFHVNYLMKRKPCTRDLLKVPVIPRGPAVANSRPSGPSWRRWLSHASERSLERRIPGANQKPRRSQDSAGSRIQDTNIGRVEPTEICDMEESWRKLTCDLFPFTDVLPESSWIICLSIAKAC